MPRGDVRHQVANDLCPWAPAPWHPSVGRMPHGCNPVTPAGPAGYPFGVADVAIAQSGRQQHGPQLITPQKHHHPLGPPAPVAARFQQQMPEETRLNDLVEHPQGCSGSGLLSMGMGARGQHQMKPGCRQRRGAGQITVKPPRQGAHPGQQFTRSVGHQDDVTLGKSHADGEI